MTDVPGMGSPEAWDRKHLRMAACGAEVFPRRGEAKPAHEVCKKCRKALGWPWVVTTTLHGHTFTTDFRN